MDGKRISKQSLMRNVGIGSNKHNLMGESLIILWTSSSLTGSKALKAGGVKIDASVAEPEVGNVS